MSHYLDGYLLSLKSSLQLNNKVAASWHEEAKFHAEHAVRCEAIALEIDDNNKSVEAEIANTEKQISEGK